MALSAAVAVAVIGVAVWRRSWSLWVLGFVLLVLAACVAWFFNTSAQPASVPTLSPSSP
ncbi:MAG TPA: hypothetical protein VE861_14300 [Gemmatimonadaceae bacterium]|nr:hypothetical protein [Gemmatimonadaceae bacterium]